MVDEPKSTVVKALGSMPGKSYSRLYIKLQEVITRGASVADRTAGMRWIEIHDWLNQGRYCLAFVEDRIPTAVSDFDHIRRNVEYKFDGNREDDSSDSAHRIEGTDILLDFNFELLQKALDILRFASTKLEMEGCSVSEVALPPHAVTLSGNPPPNEKPPSPVISGQPASKKSYAYDPKLLRQARIALKLKEEIVALEWFKVSRRQYIRWEQGKQKGMHWDNYKRYETFVKWAQEKNTGLPPHFTPTDDTPNVT